MANTMKPPPIRKENTPNNSLILINVGKDSNRRLNKEESTVKLHPEKANAVKSPKKSQFDRNKPRYQSAPFHGMNPDSHLKNGEVASLSNNKKSCFPSTCQHAGFLDVRTKSDKPWKRRYFVVNNNFLLSAATPHASKLERMICLEGSKISKHLKSSDMTFELFIRKHKLYFRTASPKQCETWTKSIERASKLKIKDIYRFLYELGEGQANVKVVAAKHKTTNEDCAIKIVDKRQCDKKMLKTEIQILKKIDHKNIVQIYDLIETKKYLYVVMEKCEGGELFDRIAELDGDGFSEEDTCLIMHQLCHAVKYMNEQGIVHRDLKPENILCCKPNSIREIKICDFGISKMLKSRNQQMSTLCGTVAYTAPEVLRQKKSYDYTVDYWSIGVIMYILCCGYPPFYGESDKEIEQKIINNDVEFEDEDWEHINKELQQLVAGLLNKNPKKRWGPDDVLKLTWKISAKSMSFKRSHKRFKQTVLRAKFHRHSLSKFEQDSLISRNMFKVFKPNKTSIHQNVSFDDEKKESTVVPLKKKKSIKRTSRISQKGLKGKGKKQSFKINIPRKSSKDDMSTTRNNQQANYEKYERKIAAFRGNRRSKGTEELLQLKLPIPWTTSPLPIIDDEDD